MGITKSLKKIFGRKKKEISSDISSDSSLKSPKNTRKGTVVRRASNLKATGYDPRMGIIPYGAYNPSNAKLVTADSGYPSNYEHYSNFKLKAPNSQLTPKLKGVNMEDANIYQARNFYQGMYGSQIINSDNLSQTGSNPYEHYAIPNRKVPLRSNSLCDVRPAGSGSQDSRPVGRRPMIQRRSSNSSVDGRTPYNSHSQFYSMYNYPFNNQIVSRGCNNGNINQQALFNDPRHLEATVRKMESYLALLNQIQNQMGNSKSHPPVNILNESRVNGPLQQQLAPFPNSQKHGIGSHPQPQIKQQKPVQRSRSTLQPQPDFQEREARKKRKLRRNKDSLAFDLTALKKRLEVISLEENEPDKTGSCGSLGSCGSDSGAGSSLSGSNSDSEKKTEDAGYNSCNSGLNTPDKEKSDESSNSCDDSSNSGDDSSDSGVATPPLIEPTKTIKTLTNLNDELFKRRIIGRTRTKSE